MDDDADKREGEAMAAEFLSRAGKFGSQANPGQRLASEKRANRTPKQRARKKATRIEQLNVRVELKLKQAAAELAKALDVSMSEIVHRAIYQMHAQHVAEKRKK